MKLQQLSLVMLVIAIGSISEICAQFKVIKMESQRSLTLQDESSSVDVALKNVTHVVNGSRSKYRRDSNVTVIQIMPSEKVSRRIKELIAPTTEETTTTAINVSSSYHEIITVTPTTSSNDTSNLLKLHILSLRMGKIQENMRPKPFRKKPTASEIVSNKNDNKKSIIRIQQQQIPQHNHQEQQQQQQPSPNEIVISKKYPIKSYEKPYKMRNKWKSTKCFCQQNDKFWRCRKIQMSIARCRSDQFMCCI